MARSEVKGAKVCSTDEECSNANELHRKFKALAQKLDEIDAQLECDGAAMNLESAKTFLRRALGRPDNINARIRRAGSFATQQCPVLGISKKDVRLQVADGGNIPDNFIVLFSNDDPGRHASVIWRRGTEVQAPLRLSPTVDR